MKKTVELQKGSQSFNKYLDNCKDKVKSKSSVGYYPANVVADAYSQGFSDGEKSGKQDIIEQIIKNEVEIFTQKANQIYILSQNVINSLKENNFIANSLHINLSYKRPSVIISFSNELLNNDIFVKRAYSKIFDNKNIYLELFNEPLDIGLVSCDNLDVDLLNDDGFGYFEQY